MGPQREDNAVKSPRTPDRKTWRVDCGSITRMHGCNMQFFTIPTYRCAYIFESFTLWFKLSHSCRLTFNVRFVAWASGILNYNVDFCTLYYLALLFPFKIKQSYLKEKNTWNNYLKYQNKYGDVEKIHRKLDCNLISLIKENFHRTYRNVHSILRIVPTYVHTYKFTTL